MKFSTLVILDFMSRKDADGMLLVTAIVGIGTMLTVMALATATVVLVTMRQILATRGRTCVCRCDWFDLFVHGRFHYTYDAPLEGHLGTTIFIHCGSFPAHVAARLFEKLATQRAQNRKLGGLGNAW